MDNMIQRPSRHRVGLTDAEVLESRKRYGANVLTPPERVSTWQQFLSACRHWIGLGAIALVVVAIVVAALMASSLGAAVWMMPLMAAVMAVLILLVGFFGGFGDPLFRILITAFVLSVGISVYEYEWLGADFSAFFEPIGIIVALLLATGVAYVLERANEKTFRSLNEVNDDTPVKVLRNGNTTEVPRRDIVVGDIVMLDTGEEVPADGELLEAVHLLVDESSLTGEPPVSKSVAGQGSDDDNQRAYPINHILKGTVVMEGSCVAHVTSVGDATESGRVFEAAQVRDTEVTPLNRKLNRLAAWITRASYAVAALVVVGRLFACFWYASDRTPDDFSEWIELLHYTLQTVMIAVTLIVVAVPEGLPMSVTLSLAFSMRSLMRENALPRTMHACETMGAASVICTDKTGTLTQNRMQVAAEHLSSDVPSSLLTEMICLNSTADLDLSNPSQPRAIGNPTEGALLLWLHARGEDYRAVREAATISDRLPFSTENKYMATLYRSNTDGQMILAVKGAPEIVMAMSDLTDKQREDLQALLRDYQHRALRTLALAYKVNGQSSLRFVGIFAIADPVRPDVPEAVQACRDAGIEVKMVTGDTVGTALEIGRQVGLWNDGDDVQSGTITGDDFSHCTDDELLSRLSTIKIVSRARPTDKSRLVRLLRQQGHVVAVTGDGTNDAPALNAANVGLSMGDGTAVAKEASDMTILDNAFSTIARTVLWGRSLYRNIQRFIMYQATINVVACLIVLVGAFTGTESPLTVTQMLWVNLIMDTFAAIALASLPPQQRVMRERPRRPDTSIISRPMMRQILGFGLAFTVLLLAMLYVLQHSDVRSIADLWHSSLAICHSSHVTHDGLSAYELSLFFTTFVMLQFWNLFNARAFKTSHSAFHNLRTCRGFITIACVILFGQVAIVELGGQMFNVTPLHWLDWLLIIIFTSPVMLLGELQRMFIWNSEQS